MRLLGQPMDWGVLDDLPILVPRKIFMEVLGLTYRAMCAASFLGTIRVHVRPSGRRRYYRSELERIAGRAIEAGGNPQHSAQMRYTMRMTP